MSLSTQNRADIIFKFVQHIEQNLDWKWLPDVTAWVIEQTVTIQQIPAPTFDERKRAEYVAKQFESVGLMDVSVDTHDNVYGVLPGENRDSPGLMISAHTDTVFSHSTDLHIKRTQDTIHGPGIGDNSLGVAGILGVAKALQHMDYTPPVDLYFVATSREEGLGNLDGMRVAYNHLKSRLGGVINVEGLALGFVYNAGIAVRRLKIVARADGGHSWVHFGQHSALNGIVELGSRITLIQPPEEPRTTYNIGMVKGGHAINAIATDAELWLDLRSESTSELAALEHQVRKAVDDLTVDDLRFEIEVVGERPAGQVAAEHPLVKMALATLEVIGTKGGLHSGSTDGNVPLYHDCPTVTIGMTTGGNAHRLDEYIDLAPVKNGIKQLILLVLSAVAKVDEF